MGMVITGEVWNGYWKMTCTYLVWNRVRGWRTGLQYPHQKIWGAPPLPSPGNNSQYRNTGCVDSKCNKCINNNYCRYNNKHKLKDKKVLDSHTFQLYWICVGKQYFHPFQMYPLYMIVHSHTFSSSAFLMSLWRSLIWATLMYSWTKNSCNKSRNLVMKDWRRVPLTS